MIPSPQQANGNALTETPLALQPRTTEDPCTYTIARKFYLRLTGAPWFLCLELKYFELPLIL